KRRRAGRGEVRTGRRPHESGPSEGADRWLLAELSERGRRGHAVVRRGSDAGGALAPRELSEDARQAMSVMNPAGASKGGQIALWVLVLLGVVSFAVGLMQAQPVRTWGIYLVNLLFWSSLAITGPALAGMIQITEGRWSPTIKRIALTTAGFLPVSFVLFLVLFAGLAQLYPWVTHPVPKKEAWLNVPFLVARIGVGVLVLYGFAFALAKAVFAEG